ncbi:MAG: diaminopimelate decarboxylase [Cyclobacteriaceae bacterium]
MKLVKGAYEVGGVKLLNIANQFGTPVYVYHAEKMVEQLDKLKKAFTDVNLKIKYAAKALTNVNILKFLARQGIGVDTVSIQEVKIAIQAGYKKEDILYTPNCVSYQEIKEAIHLGVMINIDNISILEQFGHEYHNSIPVCIRLNPHIMAGGNTKISTGHIDSKFGISVLQMRHLQRVIKSNNINVIGLHVHTGSDILDADVFLKGADIVFEVAREFDNLHFIDFGSGFKVGYREGDVTTDINNLGQRITKAFKDFCTSYGRDLELWFEPGKFIVSEAGYLLVKTNVIKTTPATVFAGVNSGMNHLIRPMLYEGYHDMVNVSNPNGTSRIYSVVGYICETDTLGYDRKLNEVREGDIIAIKNAGAYGFSMSSNYNSRLRPAEILIYNEKPHLIRKEETMEDLMRNQVELDFE